MISLQHKILLNVLKIISSVIFLAVSIWSLTWGILLLVQACQRLDYLLFGSCWILAAILSGLFFGLVNSKNKPGVKTYLLLCVSILLIQLFPYLLMGKWYGMVHICIIYPFLIESSICEYWWRVFFASIISSCILAFPFMGLMFLGRFIVSHLRLKKGKKDESEQRKSFS